MKSKIMILLAISLFISSVPALAENNQYYFKFRIDSREEISKLTQIISIDNVDGLIVYAYANSREFARFQELGYRFEILPSPGSLISPPMSAIPEDIITDWDTYPTYQGYLDMMNQFAATYPNLCTIVNIGSTIQGRQLLFAKISDNVNTEEDEPEVMYSSSMHGDETTGYVLMLRLIDYLLSNYSTDPHIADLVNNLEIWINPLANPDGTYHGGNNSVSGAIRGNANYVDINRNFPDPAAGQHPDGNTWQPETVAMMNFSGLHSFVIGANFHGGVEVVNYPWDTWARLHTDNQWFIDVSRAYAESCQANSPSGYMTYLDDGITNGYAWYRVTGGRQDYMNYWRGSREVTVEISSTKLLPAYQLPAHWDYNRAAFLNWIENALYGVRGLVTDAVTGQPLPAVIAFEGQDIDSARVFTDPDVGDYHRMLAPGTYTLRFSSPGYIPQTISGIQVLNRQTTTVNVQLQGIPNIPYLAFVSHDAGVVDPEEAVSMHITIRNDGGGAAQGVVGVLSSNDPFISISQGNSAYPQILPLGGTAISLSAYAFTVMPGCPLYHQANFRLGLTADGGYIDSAFFDITIGQDIEDFETGNFTGHNWQMSGNANWVITGVNPYEGTYSAKSGVISHNQNSELSIQMNVVTAGTISFRYKVSSEASYDYLKFYIDGNLQAQWAGEAAWAEASYDVAPGAHTFKWGYYKDRSVSDGSDCAWIDFVIFPPNAADLQIVTTSLPNWTLGHSYSEQLVSSGGYGNKTWSDLYGNLAGTGLVLSSSGLISGTPSATGPVSFTARVQDEGGDSAQRPFAFTINPALQVINDDLPDGVIGSPYAVQLLASGGTGARTWADRDNDLAGSGLTLASGGLLSGTPAITGDISFTAVVTDSIGAQGRRDLTLTLGGAGTYIPGDANNSGITNGIDVVFMINYFKGGDIPPYTIDCPPHGAIFAACDANGNCVVNGIDATYLVNFLKGGPALLYCLDCPPARITIQAGQKPFTTQ